MGPKTKRGIGSGGFSGNAAPTSPDSGSGGAGRLAGVLDVSPLVGEVGDVTTGRITLGMVNAAVLILILFYWHTRGSQGGS